MNQVALVTGGATRIGRSISLHLAKLGYDIVFTYCNSKEEALTLNRELKKIKVKSLAIKWDFSKSQKIDLLFSRIQKSFCKIDLVVNNAAIFFPDNLQTFNSQNFSRILSINLIAPLLLTQHQIATNPNSHIITILDNRIAFNDKNYLSYSLTKKFLHQAMVHLTAVSPLSCRINAIAPAAIIASKNQKDLTITGNKKLNYIDRQDQLLGAIDFFLNNNYVNGETLFIDGKSRYSL